MLYKISAPYDTYLITATTGFYGIKGNLSNNQLIVSLTNMTSNNGQNYNTNIRTANYINTSFNSAANTSDINIGLADGVIGYSLSLSRAHKTHTIKIYQNTVTSIN